MLFDKIKPVDQLSGLAKKAKSSTHTFFIKLKKKQPKQLDDTMQKLHDEVFSKIDCLDCANCCKTLGPAIYNLDVERMAKYLRLKPAKLIETYLRVDEDGDFVFKTKPCPFLLDDNYCSIYTARPKACREYPHTDRKRFYQVLDITEKNAAVCPAVYAIVEELKTIPF